MQGCDVQYRTTKQNQGNRGRRLWIIHDEEVNEGPNSAEAVARGLAASDRRASINACVDRNSVAGMVDWDDTAWHAAHSATNWCSIGIEHDGFAHQSRAEWLDNEGGSDTLKRSAQLFREIGMGRYQIAPRIVVGDYAQIRDIVQNGRGSGVCGHRDITFAFGISGGHTDPGTEFPYDVWLAWATDNSVTIPRPDPTPPPMSSGYPHLGSRGNEVADIQNRLNVGARQSLTVDGVFGPATDKAVRDFQKFFKLGVDGIVGPKTKAMLDYCYTLKTTLPHQNPGLIKLARPEPTLKRGSKGAQVVALQKALNLFNGGLATDGNFGPATETAVRNFQAYLGLQADGIYGPQTAAVLNAALNTRSV